MKRIWLTLFRRSRVNAEIAEEIQSHLAMRADLERQSGLSAAEADAPPAGNSAMPRSCWKTLADSTSRRSSKASFRI